MTSWAVCCCSSSRLASLSPHLAPNPSHHTCTVSLFASNHCHLHPCTRCSHSMHCGRCVDHNDLPITIMAAVRPEGGAVGNETMKACVG